VLSTPPSIIEHGRRGGLHTQTLALIQKRRHKRIYFSILILGLAISFNLFGQNPSKNELRYIPKDFNESLTQIDKIILTQHRQRFKSIIFNGPHISKYYPEFEKFVNGVKNDLFTTKELENIK
jgi:hypothetical protein